MQIANGRILEQDALFERHDLILQGDRVAQVTPPYYKSAEELVIDAEGGYVLPGLIDLRAAGAGGTAFCPTQPGTVDTMAHSLALQGVTRFVGTWEWAEPEQARQTLQAAAPLAGAERGGAILQGVRLRGLFTGPDTPPDPALLERLAQAGPLLLPELAPQLPGATGLLRQGRGKHTFVLRPAAAGYDQTRVGLALGAALVDDLPALLDGLNAKAAGALAAASESGAMVEVFPGDFHPAALRLLFQLFADRICLVSGGRQSLADCLRTTAWFGVPLLHAVKAATLNPAKLLGLEQQAGRLAQGSRADLVVLDLHDLSLRTVVIGGRLIWDKGEPMSLGG